MSKSYYVLNRSGIILTPGKNGCGNGGECERSHFTLGTNIINILDKKYWKRSTDNLNLIFNTNGNDEIFKKDENIYLDNNNQIRFINTTPKTFEIICIVNMYINVLEGETKLNLFLKNINKNIILVNTITFLKSSARNLQMSFTCIKDFNDSDVLSINTQGDNSKAYYGIDNWTIPTMTITLSIKEL